MYIPHFGLSVTIPNAYYEHHLPIEHYDTAGYNYFRITKKFERQYYISGKHIDPGHGLVQWYMYGTLGDLTVGTDSTKPERLKSFGSARYHGQMHGFLLDRTNTLQLNEAYATLSMRVSWDGSSPSVSGVMHDIRYSPADVNQTTLVRDKSKAGFRHLASTLTMFGARWEAEPAGFYGGTIGCVGGCATSSVSAGNWSAVLGDTGSGHVDPVILNGAFKLVDYTLDGLPVDMLGLLYGRTQYDTGKVYRGHGRSPYSPLQALTVRVISEKYRADAFRFDALSVAEMVSVIRAATTMASSVQAYDDRTSLPLRVGYADVSPQLVWADLRLQDFTSGGEYRSSASGLAVAPPPSGSASYAGYASGVYTSQMNVQSVGLTTFADAYVSPLTIDVAFHADGPILSGLLVYDFSNWKYEDLYGTLSLSGGSWDSARSSFSDGRLTCVDGCRSLGTVNGWSGQFIDPLGGSSTVSHPGGMIGKFGGLSVLHYVATLKDYKVFHTHGIFVVVDQTTARPSARPGPSTYFPSRPHEMLSGAAGAYHRRALPDSLHDGRRTSRTSSPRVVKAPNGDFLHAGGTLQLSSSLWDWRTDDQGNCYCTMYLVGDAFDAEGNGLPLGLTSDPRYRWQGSSTVAVKHGWVAGLWRRDIEPELWHDHGGATELGLFVDGTAPSTLPSSGSATYAGDVTGYSMPSTTTLAADIKVINGRSKLTLSWSQTVPGISGELSLVNNPSYANDPGLIVSLGAATWSPEGKRFSSGELRCSIPLCTKGSTIGVWEGILVRTGGDQAVPGMFAGAFAMTGVESMGLRDIFGWFTGTRNTQTDSNQYLLKVPGLAVRRAIQDGFGEIYTKATPAQRAAAVEAVGSEFNAPTSGHVDYGLVTGSDDGQFPGMTGFWTTDLGTGTLGVFMRMDTPVEAAHLPRSGTATYVGNAVGFYSSGSNGDGLTHGDVSLTMQFHAGAVTATGSMGFDFGGATGHFDMSAVFAGQARDGQLSCGSGCALTDGTGKWGGHFFHAGQNQPRETVPVGFVGEFGASGIKIGEDVYDTLGTFTTLVE